MDCGGEHDGRAVQFVGKGSVVWNAPKQAVRRDLLRRCRHEFAPVSYDFGGVIVEPVEGSAQGDGRSDGVELKFEGRDHAKVASATAYGPEQVGVFVLVGYNEMAIRGDHVDRNQRITGHAALSPQPPEATTESEPR